MNLGQASIDHRSRRDCSAYAEVRCSYFCYYFAPRHRSSFFATVTDSWLFCHTMDWSSTIPRSSESTKREHSKKSKTLLTTDDADPDDDARQDSPEELNGNTLSSLSNLDNMNRYVTKDHTRRIRRKCQMVLRGRETMWICNEVGLTADDSA